MTLQSPPIDARGSPVYIYLLYAVIGLLSAISLRIIGHAIISPPMNYDFTIIGHREMVVARAVVPDLIIGSLCGILVAYFIRQSIRGDSRQPAVTPGLLMIPATFLLVGPFICAEFPAFTQILYRALSPALVNPVLKSLYPVNIWTLLLFCISLIAALSLLMARLSLPRYEILITSRNINYLSWLLCLIFIIVFSILNVRQTLAGNMGYHDGGFAAEELWNTLNGRFMFTCNFRAPPLIADHFAPLVLLLLPVYAIYPEFVTLGVVSAVALGLCIPLSVRLARHLGLSEGLCGILAVAVFLYPPLTLENSSYSYGFQTEHLSVPLLLAAFCHLPKGREGWTWRAWCWLTGWLLLALLTRETVALPVLMTGVYVGWQTRRVAYALPLVILGLAWGWGVPNVIVPWLRGSEYYLMTYYYASLGDTLGQVIWRIVTEPGLFMDRLLTHEVGTFAILMLFPLAFWALWRLDLLALCAGTLFFLIIADARQFMSIEQHYKCTVMPVVIAATAAGVVRAEACLQRWWGWPLAQLRQAIGVSLLLSALLMAWMVGAGPLTRGFNPKVYNTHNRVAVTARQWAQNLPAETVVYATQRIGSQFTARRAIFVIGSDYPVERPAPDILLLDMRYAWGSMPTYQEFFDRYVADPGYVVLMADDPIWIIARRAAMATWHYPR